MWEARIAYFSVVPKNFQKLGSGLLRQIESETVERTETGWLCSVLQAQLVDNGSLRDAFHGIDPTHPK